MNWYKDLYVSENLTGRAAAVRQEIEAGRYRRNICLITLAVNGKDLFDIRKAPALNREDLREHLPLIVGLAQGHENAVRLACGIIRECYEKTGDVDIKSYLGV